MSVKWEKEEGTNNGKLTFEIEPAKIKEGLDVAFNRVKKSLNVPGFRKGKVPRQIFNKMFGEESLYQDALNAVLPEAYTNAVKESDIKPVDQPEIDVESMEKDSAWVLTAKVTVEPEVELGEYKGLEVAAQSTEVTDEDVDAELNRMREQQAELVLKEDAQLLDDVVVIGYATGSQRTISGAVQKVGREEMNAGVVVNPLSAIKGKVAGVNIQKTGGDPTAAPAIRVRGTTSLTGGNDPLVIIDGVFGDLNMLNAISPADIENFTVLKDASETAQYGSRGASGVIVVTTIKGKNGVKSLSYDGSFGIETVYKNLEMLDANQYRAAAQRLGVDILDKGHNTDFIKEMQQTGYTQNHRLSFSNGNDDSNYRASIGVIDQKGIIKNNTMRNYTAKIDAMQNMFNNKLKLEFGMFGSLKENRYVNDYQKTFYSAASYNPTFPNFKNPETGMWDENANANEVQNPLGRLDIDDRETNAFINTNARITWSINNDLKLSAFGSYTYNVKENKKYIYGQVREGSRAKDFELAIQWLLDCGLIHKVQRIQKPDLPLKAYIDFDAFKLFLVDIGLLIAMTDLDAKVIIEGNKIFTEFKGALTEQYILQQLISDVGVIPYYYSTQNSKGEIDFLVQGKTSVIPIEVKAEENLKAKSLKAFCEKYQPSYAVRTSMSDYREQDWMTNIPLYAIKWIKNYVNQ